MASRRPAGGGEARVVGIIPVPSINQSWAAECRDITNYDATIIKMTFAEIELRGVISRRARLAPVISEVRKRDDNSLSLYILLGTTRNNL